MRRFFYRALAVAAFVFASSMFLAGCQKKEETEIVFDDSFPLALAPDVEWCVVTEPYVAYKKNSDWGAEVTGHCRKGEIIQIRGKRQDSSGERWYYTEKGWLPGTSVSIYSNRLKAQKVADEILAQ